MINEKTSKWLNIYEGRMKWCNQSILTVFKCQTNTHEEARNIHHHKT
jgi:hypothetical protein